MASETSETSFPRGGLLDSIRRRTAHALSCRSMQPLETTCAVLEDRGVRFQVRILASLARKDEDRVSRARHAAGGGSDKSGRAPDPSNPFLPYDEDLFVCGIPPAHVGLLNKFQVVRDHLLIVTRLFEEQESLLTPADFEAVSICLGEFAGIVFYNAGTEAGASQRHKHLQMIPLPLDPGGPDTPFDGLFASCAAHGEIQSVAALPFQNAFVRLAEPQPPRRRFDIYRSLLGRVGIDPEAERQSKPYNFLMTRNWMLLVPRSKEHFAGISFNSLAFAGALLARNAEELNFLKAAGPMEALRSVATPLG